MRNRRVPVSVRWATYLYSVGMYLLPAYLRHSHGPAMRKMYRELARDAHREGGPAAVVRTLLENSWDLAGNIGAPGGVPRWASTGTQDTRTRRTVSDPGAPPSNRDLLMRLPDDIVHGLRALKRRPTLVAAAALTLSLGIGASTAVFSVSWGAWLRPLPYPDADRIVRISDRHESFEPGQGGSSVSIGNYVDLKEGNRTFESTTIFTWWSASVGETGRNVNTVYTEPTFFETLGISPAMGRGLTPADAEGDQRGTVISHGLWQSHFGGAQDVIGREIILGGISWTVVGVAPENLALPREIDAVIPFVWTPEQRNAHGGRSMQAMGRLKPGVSIEAARTDLQGIYATIAADYPEDHEGWTSWVSSFREYVVGRDHTVLQLMGAAALLLLLVTCVNVASLLLVRAESRNRELAVRAALGAGRRRILSAFLGESLVLGVLGGALGIGVGYLGVDLLVNIFGNELRRPSAISMDETSLLVAVGLTLLTTIVMAVVPALRVDLTRLTDALRQTSSGGRRGVALRQGLVVVEITLAVVLVTGAGLLLRTTWELINADLGFEPSGAVALNLDTSDAGAIRELEPHRLYEEIREALRGTPGVVAVGAANRAPPNDNITTNGVSAAGRPETSTDFVALRTADPDYFSAVGLDFIAGGSFPWIEPVDAEEAVDLPVVVNTVLAQALFGRDNVVGESIEYSGTTWRVVGVVPSVRQRGANAAPSPMIYRPWPAQPLEFASLPTVIVRGTGSGEKAEASATAAARRALESIDPGLRFRATPLSDRLDRLYQDQRFALSLIGVFSGLALILGAVGIYGVVSYTVTRRTREMGIRIALGARRSSVLGGVVRRGLVLTVLGLAFGFVTAAASARFLASLLYGVSALDPVTFGAVGVLFLATATLACLVPARRAAAVEPTIALREE